MKKVLSLAPGFLKWPQAHIKVLSIAIYGCRDCVKTLDSRISRMIFSGHLLFNQASDAISLLIY